MSTLHAENHRHYTHMAETDSGAADFDIEVFYDGDCPLCRREINLVRRLDRRNRIRLTDIAAPDFRATDYGLSQEGFMNEILGRLPSGEWLTGVEVFRRMYAAVGCRLLVALSRLPGISGLAKASYRVFARNRLRWTGRCNEGCSLDEAGA